jgi:glycosyltransferase involved in cell wall biosynthesis
MKIITTMYTLRRGGAYDRFIMMLEAFLERDCEIHCLSLTPIRIKHSLFRNHVMYFPFKKVDAWIAGFVVFSVFPLWTIWIACRNKIDLIIAFGSLYAFIQSFSKYFLKRPMVTLIRGSLTFGFKMRNLPKSFLYLNRMIENIGLRFSDRIITNTINARKEILNGLRRKKNIDVQVLYNNIPPMNINEPEDISQTRDKYGIPRNSKVLVTAGILNRGKNIERLIESLSKSEMRSLYLLIVGDGSTEADFRYKHSLQRLAKKLEVEKRAIFTGWLEKEELWKIYLASDLFVLPSLSEGMPNAMLEALGAGLPCVGSYIAGVKDILQCDELLFDPLDEKALTQKIRRVFSDSQFLERIKRLCQERKKVFEFDWRKKVFQIVTMGLDHAHCKL